VGIYAAGMETEGDDKKVLNNLQIFVYNWK
jgi:hypothetical protein